MFWLSVERAPLTETTILYTSHHALLHLIHSSSNKSEVGQVKKVSTTRICSSGMANSFHNTSQAGSSLTAPPVNCFSISMTACFRLKPWRISFLHFSHRQRHVLLILRSYCLTGLAMLDHQIKHNSSLAQLAIIWRIKIQDPSPQMLFQHQSAIKVISSQSNGSSK